MDYKINRKSHVLAILDSIGIISIVFTIGLIIIFYIRGAQFLQSTLWFFVVGYLILALPALFIYLEYYLTDKDVVISVNYEKHELLYKKSNVEKIIAFNDIMIFQIFGETGNFYWFPSSTFSFARLITKKGEEIFFTKLIKYKLEDIIPSVRVEKRRWLFPSICLYKYFRTNIEIHLDNR